MLWTASMYLFRAGKNNWMTVVPAVFMSAVTMTYFFCAPECLGRFGPAAAMAYPVGLILAALFLVLFLRAAGKHSKRAG